MSVTFGRCRPRHLLFLIAGCWLLLLAGCGPGESDSSQTQMEAELYANDDMVQTFRRLFFPTAYWREKSAFLQERVRTHQEAFNEQTKAYHLLLVKRREKVNEAIIQAVSTDKSSDDARRLVIQEYRIALDPVREEARQLGKELRRLMTLQAQVDMAARR